MEPQHMETTSSSQILKTMLKNIKLSRSEKKIQTTIINMVAFILFRNYIQA